MSRFSYYLPILGYHRVGTLKGDHVPTVSVDAFERQMRFLARRFQVIDLKVAVDCLDRSAPLPRKSAVITFDDGYEETYTLAWPVLRRLGFPATLFVTVEEIGRPGFATWVQVREMAQHGISIGCHTMHHRYLPAVPTDRLPQEIVEAKRVLEERLGQPVQFISYPVGGFTAEVQALVKQAGYRAACTTNRVSALDGVDRFALRRVKVTERDGNVWLFRAKLSGYYDAFRRLRQPG